MSLKSCLQKAAALFVLLVLCFSLTGCSGGKGTVPAAAVRTVAGAVSERKSSVRDRSLHLVNPKKLGSAMASSGLMQLFLDDNSFGIALYEKTQKKYWFSMPAAANAGYDNSAATVTLDVLYGNTLYKLNSQDDSVAYGNVACDTLGDNKLTGFHVSYVLTADEATAKKLTAEQIFDDSVKRDQFSKTDIAFLVRVTYELLDGNLYASAEWKNLSENTDAVLCNLSLLPFFGASYKGEKGDFMLVPDGCGAEIFTAVKDPAFKPLTLRVYGDNPSAPTEGTYPALFPAFGAKQGENAFAVIIENGDAIASVHADRADGEHGFNTIGASFCITETASGQKNGQDVTYVSRNAYTGRIKLCVRLLGGSNADLDGMAAACREQFMRTGYLSADTVSNEEYLPFRLNVIGAAASESRIPLLPAEKVLTTFEQAQDLLSRLKAKGINNMDVRYMGVFRGGTSPRKVGSLAVSRRLGGKKGLSDLFAFTVAQGHSLFLDTPVVSWDSSSKASTEKALSIQSTNTLSPFANALAGVFGTETVSRKLLRLSDLEDTVIRILTDAKELEFDGFCIADASRLLYSDYGAGYTDRQTAMQMFTENLPALSTDRLLMADTGNFYAIRYADLISDLPISPAAGERKDTYASVPFVQMILHGTVDYSGSPVNLAENSHQAQLRAIEYGCCPCYEWCFSIDGGDKFCFENQLSDAVEYYVAANEALAGLRDARIVENGATETSGVRFTRFDNGAILYVNYNEKAAAVGNIHIDGQSFQRIG